MLAFAQGSTGQLLASPLAGDQEDRRQGHHPQPNQEDDTPPKIPLEETERVHQTSPSDSKETKQPSALSRGVRCMSAGNRPFQNPRRVSHPEQSEGSRLGH